MNRIIIIIAVLLLIPADLFAQFQQKVSLNLSAGIFNTLGEKTYMPDWGTSGDDREPFQMSNYRPGLSATLSIQYNINRRISVMAELGYMNTASWKYTAYEDVNYLDWEIYDTLTDELLRSGSNSLTMTGMAFGFGVKYYILSGRKVSPFLLASVEYTSIKAEYTENEWQALDELGMLDPDDTEPWNPWLEKNRGFGINPGAGMEVNFSDRIGIFLICSYRFISMKEENFKMPEQQENFHAVNFQCGIKFSFWKSREL
jgi:opacity protein-like surface antigen